MELRAQHRHSSSIGASRPPSPGNEGARSVWVSAEPVRTADTLTLNLCPMTARTHVRNRRSHRHHPRRRCRRCCSASPWRVDIDAVHHPLSASSPPTSATRRGVDMSRSAVTMRLPSWTAGPGAYFAHHPTLYRLSLAGAAGAAVTFAANAKDSRTVWPRLGWVALSMLEAVQLVGTWWVRRRAVPSVPTPPRREIVPWPRSVLRRRRPLSGNIPRARFFQLAC